MRPQVAGGAGPGNSPETSVDAILAHLDRVLASRAFSGAWRQQRLLRYLVERYAQGRTADLKEYSLGVEVFDKGESFDPRLDPIVRVEVSRLRTRLHKYYQGEGSEEALRIILPKGSYVPQIVPREETVAASAPGQAEPIQESQAGPGEKAWKRGAKLAWLAPVGLAALSWALILGLSWQRREGVGAHYDFSRITREQARCNSPSLSPDGKWVLYARQEKGQWDIFLRSLVGEEVRNLTSNSPADDWQPAFSPDGKRFAFRSENEGGGLFVMGVEGGSARKISSFGYHPAWSPDGKFVVFSSGTFFEPEDGPARRAGELFVVDAETGAVRQVTSSEAVYDAVQPSWSPHGYRIAFWASGPDGKRDIWTISASANDPKKVQATPVTQDAWLDWSPSWSPDGKYLYFSSDRDGSMNLWRVRIDEETGQVLGVPEAVRTPSAYSTHASLSRDGNSLVYTQRTISSILYAAPFRQSGEVDLNGARAITGPGRQVREPEFSPQGEWLSARIQDPEEDIVIMRPDGSQMRRLTNDKFKDRNARWSPDGSYLLFLSDRGGKFEYWTVRPDSSGLRKVAPSMTLLWGPDAALVAYPANGAPYCVIPDSPHCRAPALAPDFIPMSWSPDGGRIVGRLRSSAAPREELYVYELRGGKVQKVTDHGWSPVWLKDSARLLYWEANTIFLVELNSGARRPVLRLPGKILQQRFTLSPDQKTLYYVETEVQEDIWLAKKH